MQVPKKCPELPGKFAQRLGYKWAKPWSTFLIALRIGLQAFWRGNKWLHVAIKICLIATHYLLYINHLHISVIDVTLN